MILPADQTLPTLNMDVVRAVNRALYVEVCEIGPVGGYADFESYHYVERRCQDDAAVLQLLLQIIRGLL